MSTMDPALNIKANPQPDGYGNNPRCLRRDVNNNFVTAGAGAGTLTPSSLVAHITSNTAGIGLFQDSLQNDAPGGGIGKTAIHSSGHFSIWGDPGGDVFVSPGEPAFWLHHSQLDRHWWMWTMYEEGDVGRRTGMYDGGTIWMNPNSARGKATDAQWLDVVAPVGMDGIASNQLFSTTAGPFCYVYQ
jgi:tyrosinase